MAQVMTFGELAVPDGADPLEVAGALVAETPAVWYGITWEQPRTLAQLDSSTLADLIRAAADELAARGYWTAGRRVQS